ncbi:uncharacterized protein ACN427_014126 [Glossina fuscipes fuscipes]
MKARMQSKFGKTANSSGQIAQKTPFEVKMDEAPSTSKFAAAAAPRRNWRPLSLNPKFNGPRNQQIAQDLVPSNQCKTEINDNWDDDDDEIFASISTQEILPEDVKMDENPSTSKFAAVAAPVVHRKWRSLALNAILNPRPPPQLCETPGRSLRQIETTTSTPGVNRPKRGRLSGLSRNYTNTKK